MSMVVATKWGKHGIISKLGIGNFSVLGRWRYICNYIRIFVYAIIKLKKTKRSISTSTQPTNLWYNLFVFSYETFCELTQDKHLFCHLCIFLELGLIFPFPIIPMSLIPGSESIKYINRVMCIAKEVRTQQNHIINLSKYFDGGGGWYLLCCWWASLPTTGYKW